MATVKRSERNFWHREATAILRGLLDRSSFRSREALAKALANVGEVQSPKVLSNRISRGTFSFIFFLQCMRALGRSDVRFLLDELSPKQREALKEMGEARARSKVRRPRVRHVKAPIKSNQQR
jgi:hypothetical protein